jgi:ABC-type Fe3+-siderophore transport system permease subunit
MKEEDDMDELVAINNHTQNMALPVQQQAEASTHPKLPKDHCSLPRSQQHKFHHDQALACIRCDYLGPNRLLGAEFQLMFHITQGQFQDLMEDVMVLAIHSTSTTATVTISWVPPSRQNYSCPSNVWCMEFLSIVLWIILLCLQQCVFRLDASSTLLLPICINTNICKFQMQMT